MRLDEKIFEDMVGKMFLKYKCDPFTYTNSVSITLGLYIGDNVYELRNEQQAVDYYGSNDDYAIWNIQLTSDENIKSAFVNIKQIVTPVNETINSITLVEENQKLKNHNRNLEYDIWLTRAIIFHTTSRDICFEKDNTAFSEEIIITKGYALRDNYPKSNEFFLTDWDEGIETFVEQKIIEIK